MTGIGNDIVDLTSVGAPGKYQDLRFLKKVLTDAEQAQLALAGKAADRLLWSFWAAKETAYKAVSQLHEPITAAPRRYGVCLDTDQSGPEAAGHVQTPAGIVWIRLHHRVECLHCIGVTDSPCCLEGLIYDLAPVPKICTHQEPSPAEASLFVRRMASEKIASSLNIAQGLVRITRRRNSRGLGPPTVCIGEHSARLPASLSHHGRFAGYAVLMAAAAAAGHKPSAA